MICVCVRRNIVAIQQYRHILSRWIPPFNIQLCIQLWLLLFNTHNYQAIIMIIGFTSLIVCMAAIRLVFVPRLRMPVSVGVDGFGVICLLHGKREKNMCIYLQWFYFTVKWMGFLHGRIVAQGLTFSTITCILIWIRIFLFYGYELVGM